MTEGHFPAAPAPASGFSGDGIGVSSGEGAKPAGGLPSATASMTIGEAAAFRAGLRRAAVLLQREAGNYREWSARELATDVRLRLLAEAFEAGE